MSRARPHPVRVVFWLATTAAAMLAAQPTAPALGPVVELPPMIVAESAKSSPWLYVAAGDTEFLSRCSPAMTKAFVSAQLEIHRRLRAIVPPDFLASYAIPIVSVLVPLESAPAKDDAVFRDMLKLEQDSPPRAAAASGNTRPPPVEGRIQFLPNQRLDDRDMMAVFTFLNESDFDPRRLIVAPEYVHALLTRRTPMLPQWLIEGVTGLYREVRLRGDPITLPPVRWISPTDTAGLQNDAESRRVLLPCDELFAPDALLGPDQRHPARQAVWRAQSALFVRWALDPAQAPARDALWKFARRSSHEPVSESIFVECFGFGYADLRDRLSDYLPTAVKTAVELSVGRFSSPLIEPATATREQIARLRGEWERLEVPFVREVHPQFLPRYIGQARQTIQAAYSRGERDPSLLAAFGLAELDSGDAAAARPLLEQAIAAHLVRPRIYFEVARLRWEDLTRGAPESRRYTPDEVEPVLHPLRRALALSPPLPEVFLLSLDVWLRCTERVSPIEFDTLAEGARLFRRIPVIGLRTALLHAKHGRRAEAIAVLSVGLAFATEPAIRASYQEVLAALNRPPPGR